MKRGKSRKILGNHEYSYDYFEMFLIVKAYQRPQEKAVINNIVDDDEECECIHGLFQ